MTAKDQGALAPSRHLSKNRRESLLAFSLSIVKWSDNDFCIEFSEELTSQTSMIAELRCLKPCQLSLASLFPRRFYKQSQRAPSRLPPTQTELQLREARILKKWKTTSASGSGTLEGWLEKTVDSGGQGLKPLSLKSF